MAGRLRAALPYAAVLVVALLLWRQADTFAALGREGQLGPAFWPRAVLALLMVVCAAEIVRLALFHKPEKEGPILHSAAPVLSEGDDERRWPLLLAGGVAITLLYVPALQLLGFFLATVLYLAAFILIGRYRRPAIVAATSILGALAFLVIFMKVVYVSLPLGAGPFRAFSALLLAALGIR